MRFHMSVGLALAAVLSPLAQSEAWAWFKFSNKTSKPVYVAFVHHKPGCEGGVPWEKRGWWRLEPGQTKTVQGDAITNRYSYYFAESDDRAWVWTSGGPVACLPQPAFTWCWNTCNTNPNTRNLGVRKVDTGSSTNFTLNLTPPPGRAEGPPAAAEEDAANEPAAEEKRGEQVSATTGGDGKPADGENGGGRTEVELPATAGAADPMGDNDGANGGGKPSADDPTDVSPEAEPAGDPAVAGAIVETRLGYEIDRCSGRLSVKNKNNQWVTVPRGVWTTIDVAVDGSGYWYWRCGSTGERSRGAPAFRFKVKRLKVWHSTTDRKITWWCYDLVDDVRTVRVTVHRHSSVPLTTADADRILADMGTVLQTKDQPNDTPTKVRFVRNGDVRVLPATVPGAIQTQADWNALMGAGTGVKVVRDIRWCGGPGGSIIGCAPVGNPVVNLAVVRFTASQEGILWGHEYGHNCGLGHRTDDANAVMFPSIASNRRVVNPSESSRFLGGPVAATGAVMAGTSHDHKGSPPPKDVKEFVRQHYFDGVPYEAAAAYTEKDAEVLIGMLADAENDEYLPEIVTTLCFIGSEKAVEPLIKFVKSEVDTKAGFKAKNAALIHLGDLIHKSKSKAAVKFLEEVAGKPAVAAKLLAGRVEKATNEVKGADVTPPTADELTAELSVSATQGLGLAGTEQAQEVLKRLKTEPAVLNAVSKAVDDALKTSETIQEKGQKEYHKKKHE